MHFHQWKRREFIGLLGGAAVGWPLAARAQQPERVRRIGVLIGGVQGDPSVQPRVIAFQQALKDLGWIEGRNLQVEYRWTAGDVERTRAHAAELVALAPDVILAHSTPVTSALQQATRTLPIVFVQVTDPLGTGFVASLSRPAGNVTGFTTFELSMGSKWLDLLKELAPRVDRVALMQNEKSPAWTGQLRAVEAVAPSFGVQIVPAGVNGPIEIENTISAFGREPNVGLIVMPDTLTLIHRKLIVTLAHRLELPAVYPFRYFPESGGLLSYGIDLVDVWRRAATYIDRILKGAKPADLPIQQPTKFELVVNLKTAKTLGLDVPTTLLARADEVIE
jgi:putative ABC transport system substrate-binding protein